MAYRGLKGGVGKVGIWTALLRDVRLAWRLVRDPRVGLLTKLVLPGVFVVFLLSPADIMQAIPIIGELDDLALAALAIGLFIRLAPRDIVLQHRAMLAGQAAAANSIDGEYRVVE
jgi:uncharacterized membrane protein YkvA (DUF1232 family)